jgi:DNA invertase Pin-like site-specific DNA recombinase
MKVDEIVSRPVRPADDSCHRPTGESPWGTSKIRPWHLDRLAMVYVRQSTPQQVLEHRESAALQYDLRRRAVALGWAPDRVVVIDEDQGHSGETAEGRLGFQRLLTEVSLDRVGVILGIEMSRLARAGKDWHQLLEICTVFQTILADQDGLYDPGDFNDRLLLGLKGTMSEAELHILRGRMLAGRRNKARRGELFSHAPIGFVRLLGAGMALDPDEQAQAVVRLVFDKFRELGTVTSLLRYMVRNGIRLGVRPHFGPNRGNLEWRRPNRVTLTFMLHHPIYAGAYSDGRRPTDRRRKVPGRPGTGRRVVPMDEWGVLIRDHLPSYISWEQYETNLQQLARNRARAAAMGAPRDGNSLLAGLVVCGRCGRRMLVSYPGHSNAPRYSCQRGAIDYAEPRCQSLVGKGLDELVERLVLAVLEPASLELIQGASEEIRHEREQLHRHWQQRLERVRYDADRAARQYHEVEPENRLVARELERRWEQALVAVRDEEEHYDRFRHELTAELTPHDREMIMLLASDIPALLHTPTTSASDRRVVVRFLIEQVEVTVQGETEWADVVIHWAGGFVSRHEVCRPVRRLEQLRDFSVLMDRVLELHRAGKTSSEIADHLNAEGFRPAKRRETFNRSMVRQMLSRRLRSGPRPRALVDGSPLQKHEWWLTDLARELGIPVPTVHTWLRRGWITCRKLAGAGGRWILWADDHELDRLRRLRACPRSWADQPYPAELTTPKTRST